MMIIEHGLVVTFDPDALSGAIIEDGAVVVDRDAIVTVGPTRDLTVRFPSVETHIDANGKVVMPGLIVTHTHMPYVLGHNMPVDLSRLKSFWDMLQKMGWEWLEDITTQQGIYAATRYAAMKMLKNGTTTVCEMVEGPGALPGALQASVRAIEEIGIRAQLGFEVTERIPGVSILERLDPAMAEKGFAENSWLLDRYPPAPGSLIRARLGVHTAFTNSLATLRTARQIADQYGCGIQIHIAEIPRAFLVEKFGKSAPMVLEEQGLLGPDVVAAHCIDLSDEDLEILRRNGVNVAHTPMTNSLGGNGVARVPEMLSAKMNVTIGHDCFFTLDTAEYLRYAYLLHKAHNANPSLLPPFQVLDMVFGHAARALDEPIGRLAAGARADIVIIEPDSPVPTVPSSLTSFLLMTFQGRNVRTVIVNGKVVVEEATLVTGDEDEITQACLAEARTLWRKNGIEVPR